MKTILFVYHVSSIGGGSFCLLNILKELDRNRFRPIVLLKNDGPLAKEIKDLGIELHILPNIIQVPYNKSLFSWKSLYDYYCIHKSLVDFRLWLKRMEIDLVYINTMMLYPYIKVAKECGVKTIIHIRECWPKNEHKKQLALAQKVISEYADHIIAINKSSARIVPQTENKTTIIYDWIDFSNRNVYYPLDEIFKENLSNLKVFLYTGGLQKIKGAYEVVTGFSKCVKGENSRLLFLGHNLKRKKTFKYMVKQILYFLGFDIYEIKVNKAILKDSRIYCVEGLYEIKHIIEQAFCVISYFTKPHANLILAESIILGIPVLAANTEESMEYSNNGELAILFDFNNKHDFYKNLSNIDALCSIKQKSIDKNANVIAELFNKERNVKVLNSLLCKILYN